MSEQVKLIKSGDKEYPVEFSILDTKPAIYSIGSFFHNKAKVGIIGSRKPTSYGLRFTYDLTTKLSQAGIITVSGFARGIDSACHQATVESNGRTIAILGSGIDVIYPPENKKLFENILEKGAIISEFKPGTPPFKQNFPRRNRLISALSDLLVVVEAAERSGTLITVDHALEQGKDVMVLPGSIYSKQSRGTNKLIKQGAEPITSIESVLTKLNVPTKSAISKTTNNPILKSLNNETLSIEQITQVTGKTISEVSLELSRLQIEGLIREDLSGKYYRIS